VQVELRQLRYFVAVAEELHFRRAAQRLLLTQPALSHQIARLEHQLGVRLLERDRRSVVLTAAGATLLEGARRLLHQADQTIAATRWASGVTFHALRLGYPSYAVRAIRALLNTFRERHPDVWLDEHQLQSNRVRAALLDRTLDVGFVNLPVSGALITAPLVPERLTVLLPAAHRLASRERVPLVQLADEPFLMANASSAPGYQAAITACCQQAGFIPTTVRLEGRGSPTMDALARAVASGRGLLLLVTDVPEPVLPEVVGRPVDLSGNALRHTFAWRSDDRSPFVQAFTALVRDNSPIGR
jgi:DNA-binding transcriptional LysR family regulator